MSIVKAIFITGGASGIGRATARLFASRGWRVGVADVNDAGLDETVGQIGGMASRYTLDVRDREAWVRALDAFTAASGGRLDVLFNNAGISQGGPIADAPWEEIDRVVAINLMGVMNGAKIGHPYLKRTGGACLLNTASASAIYGSAGLAPYSATKFGVRALTEALEGEWHADGIRVRDLMPGFIDTPLLQGPVTGSNHSIREVVTGRGLELTSADTVAEAAWAAVHGDRLHTYVGPTAKRMAFATRWLPGRMRRMMQGGLGSSAAD